MANCGDFVAADRSDICVKAFSQFNGDKRRLNDLIQYFRDEFLEAPEFIIKVPGRLVSFFFLSQKNIKF